MTQTEQTKNLIRSAAQEHGRRRTDEVTSKVRVAMAAIDEVLVANGGAYPHNKGRLTLNELARRAEIHNTTLHADRYKDLLNEVRSWLQRPKNEASFEPKTGRRTTRELLDEYRTQFAVLMQKHRDRNLELQQAQAELGEAMERIQKLVSDNEQLESLLSSKVTRLPSKKDR